MTTSSFSLTNEYSTVTNTAGNSFFTGKLTSYLACPLCVRGHWPTVKCLQESLKSGGSGYGTSRPCKWATTLGFNDWAATSVVNFNLISCIGRSYKVQRQTLPALNPTWKSTLVPRFNLHGVFSPPSTSTETGAFPFLHWRKSVATTPAMKMMAKTVIDLMFVKNSDAFVCRFNTKLTRK